jgi:hypothetical protein
MGRQNILELEASGATAPLATVPVWNALALRTVGTAQPARALALVHTCMYNAWAAYDGTARQTVHGVAVRLPRAERDAASKAAAMRHAAHDVLAGLNGQGLDPATDVGLFTPAGIARTQAAAVLDVRHREQPFALVPAEVRQPAAGGQLDSIAYWCDVARRISVRDGYDDDRDVLLFFVLANALADAVGAAGEAADAGAAAEVLRRFTGRNQVDEAGSGPGREVGRKIGARVFDKARRYWQGKL